MKPNDVTVLIRSPDLTRHHARDGAVALTFQHGRGRVLHVMGHDFQGEGNLAGSVAPHPGPQLPGMSAIYDMGPTIR